MDQSEELSIEELLVRSEQLRRKSQMMRDELAVADAAINDLRAFAMRWTGRLRTVVPCYVHRPEPDRKTSLEFHDSEAEISGA